ncbi:hypothetical protein BDW22DRAFT_1481189 [Trametopsis cervina]|nr:hypothetical protein BDW22DRAFT_1481189 [Trametopsis cervina]
MAAFTCTGAVASAFAAATPAGPASNDAGHRSTKTKAGLGLGLRLHHNEVFNTSFRSSGSVGLGIYIDSEAEEAVWGDAPLSSFASSSGHTSSSSSYSYFDQPSIWSLTDDEASDYASMLVTRLERPSAVARSQAIASPTFSEYQPMRTPSPRLVASPPPDVVFAFAIPDAPIISAYDEDEEEVAMLDMAPASPFLCPSIMLPSVPTFSSGLNLLCLDDEDVAVPTMLPTRPTFSSGLNLLCLDDEDEEAYAPPCSPLPDAYKHTRTGVGLGITFADDEAEDETLFTIPTFDYLSSSSIGESDSDDSNESLSSDTDSSSMAPTERYLAHAHLAHPKPRRAKLFGGGWGINLTGREVVGELVDSQGEDEKPHLGFDSPGFWKEYTAVLHGQA